ncbi:MULTISPECIES: hypothetical protein [Sediminibacillus]|uniref:hypothetical protein n=1 Tax=Sediminibacillus TaxID=482460 RepID=UPI0003F5D1A7|nr:hypothetical protein [Sediminibacillus terrae]
MELRRLDDENVLTNDNNGQKDNRQSKNRTMLRGSFGFCIIDVKEWDDPALIPALLDVFDKWFYI